MQYIVTKNSNNISQCVGLQSLPSTYKKCVQVLNAATSTQVCHEPNNIHVFSSATALNPNGTINMHLNDN